MVHARQASFAIKMIRTIAFPHEARHPPTMAHCMLSSNIAAQNLVQMGKATNCPLGWENEVGQCIPTGPNFWPCSCASLVGLEGCCFFGMIHRYSHGGRGLCYSEYEHSPDLYLSHPRPASPDSLILECDGNPGRWERKTAAREQARNRRLELLKHHARTSLRIVL